MLAEVLLVGTISTTVPYFSTVAVAIGHLVDLLSSAVRLKESQMELCNALLWQVRAASTIYMVVVDLCAKKDASQHKQ